MVSAVPITGAAVAISHYADGEGTFAGVAASVLPGAGAVGAKAVGTAAKAVSKTGKGADAAGDAARACGVAGRAANTVTQGRHPLPMFLGGYAKQVLSRVDPALHGEFHSILRANLKEVGVPLNVGGRGGSAMDWADYMRTNPGAQRHALDAVFNASRYMDEKYGTSITQDVWQNIINQSFTPLP